MELHHAIFIEHIYILIQLCCSAAVCNVCLFSHLLDTDLFFFWPCLQFVFFLMEWNSIYCMARPSSTLLENISSELIHSSICKVHFSTTEQKKSSQLIFTRRLSISTQFALRFCLQLEMVYQVLVQFGSCFSQLLARVKRRGNNSSF